MPLRSYKPTSAGMRGMTRSTFEEITTKAKEKRGGMRRSRVAGHSTPWRKAIVTLAPGQKIEIFEAV